MEVAYENLSKTASLYTYLFHIYHLRANAYESFRYKASNPKKRNETLQRAQFLK